MAECNPPEPPPLLREPPHRFPTNAERNEAERQRWEQQQAVFWGDTYSSHIAREIAGCGCLVLIGVSILIVLAAGPSDPLPWMASFALLARAG